MGVGVSDVMALLPSALIATGIVTLLISLLSIGIIRADLYLWSRKERKRYNRKR